MKHYNYLALSASLLLVACGGGGGDGGGDSSPPSRTIGSISGNVFDAPVSNANVYIWEYDNGQQGRLIASTKTDTSGNYSVSVESASRPVLIRAEGGSYIDPATGQEVSISQEGSIRLDSVANYVEGSQQSVMVTPLTNMAAGLAKYKIREGSSASTAVSQSISAIEGMYGFDANTTRPVDITNGPQGAYATDGHKYGALLTAYSSYAKDMKIQKNGSENEYSSINLARIQYNDIQLDGKLDGQGKVGNHSQSLDFGAVKVTSELYTKELAKHVMIAANSPELNKSSIKADEFKPFSDKVNKIGEGDTSVIPERKPSPIDSTPPVASRPKATKNDIIARTGSIEVKLEDEVGVAVPTVVLESYLNGTWSELETCPVGEIGSSYCAIDTTEFQQGLRSSNVKINVNTVSLDDLKMSSGQARLVFYTEDVLGNKIETGSEAHIVSFKWDNQNPIIKVTSDPGIKKDTGETEYLLTGTVTEPTSGGVTVTVSFKGDTPEGLVCSPTADDGVCQFSNKYKLEQFGTSTKFEITATDAQGNVGREYHFVTQDAREPKQTISYPQEEVSFVLEDESGAFSKPYPGDFTVSTYNASSVLTAKNYLNIDYQYAANNIRNNVDVNFQSFNVDYLHRNKIPYIKVKVWDERAPDGVNVGTPANKLTLQVNYSVSKGGQADYSGGKTITANAYNQQESVTIPHEKINEEEGSQEGEDKWVASMTYYIPFTKDILGETFSKISESDAQKLVISTTDGSKNVSDPITVYFKTTFNLPTYTVVTPFVGAQAQLQGLESTGFTNIDNCTTTQNYESGQEQARDVASCLLRGKKSDFDFLRIKLASPKGKNTYSYNWTDDGSAPEEVNLEDANFGVYFEKPNGSQTFYVTELSTYHTGLFDYRWDNYQGTKNTEVVKSFLAEVNNAVALQKPGSFFGFDPTTTSYATNEMLRGPHKEPFSKLAVEYQHRFLAESMANMSKKWPRVSPDVLASKFYEDLRADGKPDGKKGQTVIELDGDELNADVYRTGLAQAYFDLLTGKPWVKDSIAQLFADDISKARPMLGTLDLFGKDGVSIDKYAPDVKLTVAGRTYTDKNQQYVAGNINATLVVSDPSGIKDKDDASTPLTFAPMWYKRSTPNHGELATGISFKAKDKNDGYVKQFDFSVDTASSEHKDKVELAIHTSAMDNQGNGYGYTDDKRKDSLFIDNEPPKVSLIRPSVLNTTTKLTTQLGSDVYLNTNKIVQLEFKVEDTVHDQKDKRALLFKDSTGQTTEFNPDYFNNVGDESFTINLCKKETNCTKPVNPGDGEWKVYVKAIDNLGNEVNEYSTSAPEFIVKIDSIPPEVENRTAEKMLGGNTTLKPAPIWGDHSPGDKLDVRLRIGSGSPLTLGFCSDDDTVPCLEGTQPDVGVKLIADAFTHGQTNTLFYRATDKAYPPNTSERGTIEFQVDKKGPVINFQDPWLVDYVSQKTGVLGAKFSAKFNSVTDDSGVEKISLYQKTDSGETFLKDWTASEWSSSFEGTYSAINDENKIVTDDSNRAKLFVKATDIHGFVSSSNVSNVIIDTQGPSLKLNGHQENDFYVPGYELTIIAEDYDDNGSINSNGVDKDKFEYWIFKGDVAPNGEGTKPKEVEGQYKIPLPSNLDTTGEDAITVKLKAQDIRGNVSTVPFKLHIKQNAPEGEITDVVYANNEPIGDDKTITKDEDIKLLLRISDISGIDEITGSYHFKSKEAGTTTGEEAGTTLSFTYKGEDQWESVIQSNALAKDGDYALSIDVYNNAKYLEPAQRRPLEIRQTLSVQRQGVRLKVKSPEDFQNFIANGELKVDFEVESAVTPEELQCWVRENYNSNQAPTDNEASSGRIEGNLGKTPSCTVTSTQNFKGSDVVLIVKTKGTNGTPNVQRFTFKEMDVEPPTSVQKDYLLKGENVIPASPSANKDKQLSIQLGFTDEESGVNINTDPQDFRPQLVRINNIDPIKPKECVRNSDGVTCRYIENYTTFIDPRNAEHIFNVKNLSDNAGNTADVSQLSLKLPEGKPTIAITSTDDIENPLAENTVVKDLISINLKTLLPNGSKLEVLTVDVGGTTYSTANTNHKDNFEAVTKCGENDEYLCAEFNANVPDTDVQSLVVTARAMDVFNRKSALNGESNQVTFIVDKEAPKVGKTVVIESQPGDKVRFTFPITDSGSGLAKVTYTVTELGTNFTREEKKGDDPTYFEVEASELANKNKLTVTVTAEDKAGHVYTENNMEVNIALPTVALSLKDNARIEGGLLVLGRTSQEMTLEVNATSSITAKSYRITLVPVSTGESIEQSAVFGGTSATSTFSFKDTDQGQYMLKVAVTDSIGRTLETFTYAGNEYGVEGIKSVVDTQDPSVSNLKAEQTTFAPNDNGEYLVEVTANVLDTNLNEVNAELALKAGGDKIRPKSVVKPTDNSKPYVYSFSVPAGVYRVAIKASDLAGKINPAQEIETEVVAATTPEVKAISAAPQGPIGGNKTTTLNIKFSEKVQDFILSDIKLTQVGGSDDVGTLSELSTTNNIDWTANYKAPQGEDKTITFTLEDDAYQSEKGIKGKGSTFNLEVKGVLPTVKSLSLNPEYADTGDTINVTVEFSQPVSEPSESYLNTSTTKINWDAASGESDSWAGTVKVPSANDTDLEMPIVIAGFSDAYKNEGVAYQDKKLLLKPKVTISKPVVSARKVTVKGTTTRTGTSAALKLTFKDKNGTTVTPLKDESTSDGAFEQTVTFGELSGLASGSVDVTAVVTNG
ncbi:hypothetical protein TW84_21640, partial [Vibrio neptunius]|uniref:Ig-like domain-containing protein n=1 Tax=Vibrio neptunius TaxID=170651 RepID=UPI0005F9EAB0